MISWTIIGTRGVSLSSSEIEAEATLTIGRRDYVSPEAGSVLTFRIPWRATGTRPAVETGALIGLKLSDFPIDVYLEHQVTDVVVDDDIVEITAVSPEWRRLNADRTASPAGTGNIDDAVRLAEPFLTAICGFELHPDAFAGPDGTWDAGYLGELVSIFAPSTLFGRSRKARDTPPSPGVPSSARFTLFNSELAAIAAPTGRTSITLDSSWIVRSPKSTRSVLNGANVITVTGTSDEVVRDTGLDSGVAQNIATILDDLADVEALADGYEEAWTDIDNSPSEGWLPQEITVLLDEVEQDAGPLWLDVVQSSLVDLDAAQPLTRVDVPVIPPSSPGGSWTSLPCYVEGVTVNLRRRGSTASLFAVPELLLRRRDVLDYVDPADIVAWFDPMRRSELTFTGTDVATIGDLGTRGLDAASYAGREPTFSKLNGRPALQFTGTYSAGSIMRTPTFTQGRPVTLFVIAKQTTIDTFIRGIMGTSSTSPQFDSRNNGGTVTWHMFNGNSLWCAPVDSDVHIHTCVFDGVDSEYYLDGSLYSFGATGTRTWSSERIALGGSNITTWPPTSQCWQGLLGEFLLVEGNKQTVDIASINNYLQQKWGLQ